MSANMSLLLTQSQLGTTWKQHCVCRLWCIYCSAGCGVYCACFTILHMCFYECDGPILSLSFAVFCCSSLLLQKLKPVLCIIRAAASSINSLTVICEKHQVPVTNSGDDVVQVLDFTFQQHHSGTLSAVLVRMVQHHVQKVTELGCDTWVMYIKEDRR